MKKMTRKVFTVILIFSILTYCLTGCDGKSSKSTPKNSSGKNTEISNPTDAAATDSKTMQPSASAVAIENIRNYTITMNMTWNFADGESKSSNACVENCTQNKTPVRFEVCLSDTDEVIYHSPVLAVGERIQNMKLDKNLAAGTYDCIITYTLLDENNHDISYVSVNMTVVINN